METGREKPKTGKDGEFGCQGPAVWQNTEEVVLVMMIILGLESASASEDVIGDLTM